jgi:hypothetical protein
MMFSYLQDKIPVTVKKCIKAYGTLLTALPAQTICPYGG